MRFYLGAIPEHPGFDPGTEWRPLKEPSPWMFQLLAVPVAVLNGIVFGLLWCVCTPVLKNGMTGTVFLEFIAAIPLLIVAHELVHAWTHPGAGRTRDSIIGFWPSRVLFFAHYDDVLTRNRFVVILLMPLVVISILPLLLAIVFQGAWPLAAGLSIFNAISACGDLFGAGLLLWQVPPQGLTRNKGWATYWRLPAAS